MPPWLVLALAVAAISFGGPLTRLSSAHPLAIAVWRLGLSLLAVAGFVVASSQWRQWKTLTRREAWTAVAAGAFLALHFWTWIASLSLTTVAASVVLVNTQPVIVAILSAMFLHERPRRAEWVGIAIAVGGAIVVATPGLVGAAGEAEDATRGNALAFAGAVSAALYFLIGRRLRGKLDLWAYVAVVYGSCFIALLVCAAAVGAALVPQPPRDLAIFVGLALGPMMVGHTGANWALRYLPAYIVNLALLGELVGATILAAALPAIREIPPLTTVLGGVMILTGIAVTSKSSR